MHGYINKSVQLVSLLQASVTDTGHSRILTGNWGLATPNQPAKTTRPEGNWTKMTTSPNGRRTEMTCYSFACKFLYSKKMSEFMIITNNGIFIG